MDLQEKRVIITGAASGIGYCMAEIFAESGSEVILSDIDGDKLNDAVKALENIGSPIRSYIVDVANQEEVQKMADDVLQNVGHVDILINNAGIGYSGEIVETSLDTWKKLMDVNFWGALYHIYAFLPAMVEAKSGHIVNISSGQAFFRLPTWGPYATTKLALGGVSELMQFEFKKFNINVTTVYPFMINTGFYDDVEGDTWGAKMSMRLLPYYSMSPESVANRIVKAIKKEKSVEMITVINSLGSVSRAISPLSNIISATSLYFLGKDPQALKDDLEGF